jgi:hypothetical protein
MRTRLQGRPGSDEWRQGFRIACEAYVLQLEEMARAQNISTFVACDESGKQIPWVWSNNEFRYSGMVGTFAEARGFAENMIGQGMRFACALEGDRARIWLTTYEHPQADPVWPRNIAISGELRWEGVTTEHGA